MGWWDQLNGWLDKPASNETVLVVAVVLGLSIKRTAAAIDKRLSYLGSVLEAIANKKPWPL